MHDYGKEEAMWRHGGEPPRPEALEFRAHVDHARSESVPKVKVKTVADGGFEGDLWLLQRACGSWSRK